MAFRSRRDGRTRTAPAPLTIEATCFAARGRAAAVRVRPAASRDSRIARDGATGGFQLEQVRCACAAGAVYFPAPYKRVRATVSGRGCHRMGKTTRVWGDIHLTEYFAGTDLVQGHAATRSACPRAWVFDGTILFGFVIVFVGRLPDSTHEIWRAQDDCAQGLTCSAVGLCAAGRRTVESR